MKTFLQETSKGKLAYLNITQISANPSQPRKSFDTDELYSLSESIAQYGIIQPLTVRKTSEGYELISGERRLRAAKIADIKKIPCYVIDATEESSALMAIVENLQRKDLDFFEEAVGIEKLIKKFGLTQEEAALKIGKSQSAIANKLRLLKLGEVSKIYIKQYNLTERHARALLKLEDEKKILRAIDTIVKRGYNVKQSENFIENMLNTSRRKNKGKRIPVFKDMKIFFNSINKTIDVLKSAGINAVSEKSENSNAIVYTITIPKV